MTDEEIDEIVEEEDHSNDRWGGITYSANQVKRVAHKINAILRGQLNKQSVEIAQKDAKIYAYEAIIANSNFKAVLHKEREAK